MCYKVILHQTITYSMIALIELAKPDYLHPCNVVQNAKPANLLLWHFCILVNLLAWSQAWWGTKWIIVIWISNNDCLKSYLLESQGGALEAISAALLICCSLWWLVVTYTRQQTWHHRPSTRLCKSAWNLKCSSVPRSESSAFNDRQIGWLFNSHCHSFADYSICRFVQVSA